MNDPIINARLSKIVEAFSTRLPLKIMDKSSVLNALENALASLESSEREVLMNFLSYIVRTYEPTDFFIAGMNNIINRYLAEKGVKND